MLRHVSAAAVAVEIQLNGSIVSTHLQHTNQQPKKRGLYNAIFSDGELSKNCFSGAEDQGAL